MPRAAGAKEAAVAALIVHTEYAAAPRVVKAQRATVSSGVQYKAALCVLL
jgi:hypothetical protein